jgi:predicted AAA+ superfamily ATPase
MMDSQTRNRELNGLVEAMEVYGLDKGLIITEMEEENITIDNKEITVVPAWKWLLKLS